MIDGGSRGRRGGDLDHGEPAADASIGDAVRPRRSRSWIPATAAAARRRTSSCSRRRWMPRDCRQVTLSFSNQFNYDTGAPYELADVDVSTDGGARLDQRVAPASREPTAITHAEHADARHHGGDRGRPGERARALPRHQSQNDFWWAINNVRINCAQPACDVCLRRPGPPGEAGVIAPLRVRRESGKLVFDWGAPGCGLRRPGVRRLSRRPRPRSRAAAYSHDTTLVCGQAGLASSVRRVRSAARHGRLLPRRRRRTAREPRDRTAATGAARNDPLPRPRASPCRTSRPARREARLELPDRGHYRPARRAADRASLRLVYVAGRAGDRVGR